MTTFGDPRLAQLLEHEGFLRRVAAALVPAGDVDDIVQEAWAAAVTAKSGIERPRAWLGSVIRRLAARRHRDLKRRMAREQQVASLQEPAPSTAEMLARMEAHRELAEAVTALDEPYRQAILLRYFEDLSPQEIAVRLAVPASTVRSRLERGVAQLRGRLERRDLRALVGLVLMPRAGERLAVGTGAITTTATGGLIMTGSYYKAAIPVGIAMLFVGLLAFDFFGEHEVSPQGRAPTAASGQLANTAATPEQPATQTQPGDAVARTAAVAPVVPIGPRYRVLDARGAAVADVPVLLEQAIAGLVSGGFDGAVAIGDLVPIGSSDERGMLSMADVTAEAGRSFRLWAGEGYLTLATQAPATKALAARSGDAPGLLVVARASTIEGQVVDENGWPLIGVRLRVQAPDLVDFKASLVHATHTAMPSARSDVQGRFKMLAPRLDGTTLRLEKSGYVGVTLSSTTDDLRHVVLHKREYPYRLTGKVVNAGGAPVWRATVVMGSARTKTGFSGTFEIETEELTKESVVLVAKRGHRPLLCPDLLQRLLGEETILNVSLQLGGEPLTQEGIVVDGNGKPLAGMIVSIWHPIAIDLFTTPEDLAQGVEGALSNVASGPAKVDTRTKSDGTFRVTGLGQQSYRYRIFDPATRASVTTDSTPAANRAMRIVLDNHARRTIRGRATMHDGRPAVGVRVAAGLTTWQTATFTARAPGCGTKTDEEGRFVLEDVIDGDTTIEVSGLEVVSHEIQIAQFPRERELPIELWQRCRFRIAIGETCQADHFEVQDANGTPLEIRRTRGAISTVGSQWLLSKGRTGVLEVSEQAVAVVLLRAGLPIAVHPVRFDGQSVIDVR